ncbi:MAG TPA: DNA adenine methylase [Polyangiaceae bacterium]|jgi:DNA adenine methylase
MQIRPEAKPVLKWAGGKRQLLVEILGQIARLGPKKIGTYYEPFVGGAAVFFALSNEQRFEHARLSDRNGDLIGVYTELRDNVDQVIAELEKLRKLGHSEETYYDVRKDVQAARPAKGPGRAARIIYLNKTGYNGLYRVNRSGEFNVPFGRYKQPRILDPVRLRAAADALQGVELVVEDFEQACRRAKRGDFVYFDPPYLPVSKTANFSAYHAEAFGRDEHRRLLREFEALGKRGVGALLSNSDTDETRKLYERFTQHKVRATRAINSKATARGAVSELLVQNRKSR